MRFSSIILPFAALALAPAAAHAEEAQKSSNDYIAFANHGGVRDWRADDRDTIYFQDRRRQWYKAELIGSSVDLPFTQFVGIDAEPSDRLDKFSSVYIRGQRYAFRSFERIEGAPPKKVKKAKAKAEG
jgi:hypothetical protein